MSDLIIFEDIETAEAKPGVVGVHAKNFASESGPQSATVSVSASGAARLNGELLLGAEATVAVSASKPRLNAAMRVKGLAVESVVARGNAGLNGEYFVRGEAVVDVYAPPLSASGSYGYSVISALFTKGGEYPYAWGTAELEALQSEGEEYETEPEYGIGSVAFLPFSTHADGITGDVGQGAGEVPEVIAVGSNYPYASGRAVLEPLGAVGLDDLVIPQEIDLFSPRAALDGTGVVREYGGVLQQPVSEVDALGAWPLVDLAQGAGEMDIEATNPIIGRVAVSQPRAQIEANGLVGRVGQADLRQPKSWVDGRSAWAVLLDAPAPYIEATGLVGRVGRGLLEQPRTHVDARATQFANGRATLDQPLSDLVQGALAMLEQPRAQLVAVGADEALEVATKAYTVNLSNAAVTEYDGVQLADIVRYRGEYYAVGPEGVYRIDPLGGESVALDVQTGYAPLGEGMLSRATFGYFYVDSREALVSTVTTADGYKREFRLAKAGREGAHTRRVKYARGVSARSWGVGLQYEGADQVRILGIEVIGEVLRRRI